jgi:DNA-binding NtrC family response regulator
MIIVSVPHGVKVIDQLERAAIEQALGDCAGSIACAARILGIKRQSLQRKMKRLGLRRAA